MFRILNLEPKSEIGLAKNIYLIVAILAVIEGILALFLVKWSIVEPSKLILIIGVQFTIKIIFLAWFSRLLQRGSMKVAIIHSIMLSVAILHNIRYFVNANSLENKRIGMSEHIYIFSTIDIILAVILITVSWSIILKIRKGVLQVQKI